MRSRPSTAMTSACRRHFKALRDIAEFFYRPDQKRYGVAIYTDNAHDGLAGGFESLLFSYGGELGDYATYKVDGIINSDKAIAALDAYKELYKFTPPGWANANFHRRQPGDHRKPGRDEHELLRVLPVADQRGEQSRTPRTPASSPTRPARTATSSPPLGGQGISIVSYSQKQAESLKFLEWFIKDETQKKWAELGGYTCSAAVLKSDEFQNATPYNKAFYETMFKVKDFWAVPENAELLQQFNQRVYPYVTGDQGTAKETLDALAADWNATFKKYGRQP